MLENEKRPGKQMRQLEDIDDLLPQIMPHDSIRVPFKPEKDYTGVINEGTLDELNKKKQRKRKKDQPQEPFGILE